MFLPNVEPPHVSGDGLRLFRIVVRSITVLFFVGAYVLSHVPSVVAACNGPMGAFACIVMLVLMILSAV